MWRFHIDLYNAGPSTVILRRYRRTPGSRTQAFPDQTTWKLLAQSMLRVCLSTDRHSRTRKCIKKDKQMKNTEPPTSSGGCNLVMGVSSQPSIPFVHFKVHKFWNWGCGHYPSILVSYLLAFDHAARHSLSKVLFAHTIFEIWLLILHRIDRAWAILQFLYLSHFAIHIFWAVIDQRGADHYSWSKMNTNLAELLFCYKFGTWLCWGDSGEVKLYTQ